VAQRRAIVDAAGRDANDIVKACRSKCGTFLASAAGIVTRCELVPFDKTPKCSAARSAQASA
jgi:hypothetical protein